MFRLYEAVFVLVCVRGVRAALTLMPHQVDRMILQLRNSIFLDEKDLIGPLPPTVCSSLDDGPFCAPFHQNRRDGSRNFGVDIGDHHTVAHLIVDGILSQRLQNRNRDAFDWETNTYYRFGSSLGYLIDNQWNSPSKIFGQVSLSTRKNTRCFRLAFNRLLLVRHVPADFSNGFPPSLTVHWDGVWEVEGPVTTRTPSLMIQKEHGSSAGKGAGQHLPVETVPWVTRLALRTTTGSLRFSQPLVVQRLLISIPAHEVVKCQTGTARRTCWGDGALICGRLNGKESWCNNLEKVARMAHSVDDNYFQNVDAGNSVHAVDQIVVIAAPSDVVRLALLEVSTTFPSVSSDEDVPPDDLALLLKPVVRKGTPSIDFSMVAVSLDATLWNLNEVLQHHMHLRLPPVLATPQEADETNTEEQPVLSVLDLFEGLRAGFFPLPPGMVIRELLEEATKLLDATLVRSDAVAHSTFEKFLQDRMREKNSRWFPCFTGCLAAA